MSASHPFIKVDPQDSAMGKKSPTSNNPETACILKHLSSEEATEQGGAKLALVVPTLQRNEESESGNIGPFPKSHGVPPHSSWSSFAGISHPRFGPIPQQ